VLADLGRRVGGSLSSKLVLQFAGKPLAYLGRNRPSSMQAMFKKWHQTWA
jgi:hypothetical protein